MRVFGPQSMLVLLLMVAAVGGLAYVLARQGPHVGLRIGAGVLAFALSSVFGMALVNRFYDYYQTWGDLVDDLAGRHPGVQALPPGGGKNLKTGGAPARDGLLVTTALAGSKSRISREGLVYLPPQYFQARYASARFPVLELLHGSPGEPEDWQRGLHVTTTFRSMVDRHQARPSILVMPNINGNAHGAGGSQCLDRPRGARNDTYLAEDVPTAVETSFRAEPVGAHWGVAGFSEGGFCAANLALRHPGVFGLAGVMSGYFQPLPEHGSDPFGGDARARLENDPLWRVTNAPPAARLPAFWLMAGGSDRGDVADARLFHSVLQSHGQDAPMVTIPHARHTYAAWNPAFPKFLTWATARLGDPAQGTAPTPRPGKLPPVGPAGVPGDGPPPPVHQIKRS
ncbi:alpha/beta hydrolase [Actinomadura logoneensis]|nr:alpha/beta hydrolase-fold protein [Actinomadura logoneensis]